MPTAKQTIDWYDENAEKYAAHTKNAAASPYHAYYEKPAIYSLLPDLRGQSVLSLGCGSGEDSAHLKELGAARSVGLDISKGLIGIAKRDHPECEFVVASMENVPFANQEFNLIYSSFALHYLPTYENVFKEANRILKPGGILVFSTGHPIGNSMKAVINNDNIKEKGLVVIKNQKDKTKKVYGDYLSNESFRTHLIDFDVTTWKQPLSNTINQLVSSGFVIEECLEPLPIKRFKEVSPEDYKVLMKIPDIIIFRARKLNHISNP